MPHDHLNDTAAVDARTSATVRSLAAGRQIHHAQLAQVCQIGTTQFSAKMRGKAPWKLREAAALAAHFGISLDELVSGRATLTQQPPSA